MNSNPDSYDDEEIETIGSRLRKRRRTGSLSSPRGGPSQASKRSTPKTTISPESKRTQTSVAANEDPHPPQPASSTSYPTGVISAPPRETISNGHHDVPLEPESELNGTINGPPENIVDTGFLGPSSQSQQLAPAAAVGPDLAALIRKIVEHGEAIDRRYGEMGYVDTESYLPLGASMHLKTQCLPILDNLVRPS